MVDVDDGSQPPARLRGLATWQVSKASTVGARLDARRLPLSARSDFAVLAALDEYGSLSQAELGRRLGLDRNDINAVVNRLRPAGYIDQAPDPADRRRNTVTITRDGLLHLDDLQSHADAVKNELLQGLNEAERRQLQA